MVIRLVTASFALTVLVMLALATPAMAHAELTGSNPADGASLDAAPRQVQLTFSEPVSPEEIIVDGPQGTRWTVGQIAVEGSVVTALVQAAGPAGGYTISYRVLSEDDDVVTGTVRFTMTTTAAMQPPVTGSGAPAATPPDDDGVPAWVWIIGSIVVVAVAALAAAVLVARRSRDQEAATGDPGEPT